MSVTKHLMKTWISICQLEVPDWRYLFSTHQPLEGTCSILWVPRQHVHTAQCWAESGQEVRADATLTLSWQVVPSRVITYDCGHVAAQPPHLSPSSPLPCRVDSTFGINNEGTKTKGEEKAYAYLLNWEHRKQGTPCKARGNAVSRLRRERNDRSTYTMETFPLQESREVGSPFNGRILSST